MEKRYADEALDVLTWNEFIDQRNSILLGLKEGDLEPQVSEAVIKLNELGYPTTSSGFTGKDSELAIANGNIPTHSIDGKLGLSNAQIKAINDSGIGKAVKLDLVQNYQAILVMGSQNLDTVKHNFNKIVDIIKSFK